MPVDKFGRMSDAKTWQPVFLMESNSVNNFFEEDLLRNIPAKVGPNWPSGLGGEAV